MIKDLISPSQWMPSEGIDPEPEAMDAIRSRRNEAILAGPGAGKTEMLAQRACFLLQTGGCPSPKRILAISFKRDAAQNLKKRVELRCGHDLAHRFESLTFDAFAKNLLDRFLCALPSEWRPSSDYRIGNVTDTELKEHISGLDIPQEVGTRLDLEGLSLASVKRALQVLPGIPRDESLATWTAGRLWHQYLHELRPSLVTFDMIKSLAVLVLKHNPLLIRALRATYSHVFLDEFQDTTPMQYDLVSTIFHGSSTTITAVGDTNQRIMLWAGAMPEIFTRFTYDFGAQPRQLFMNHRSNPELVSMQKQIVKALKGEPRETLPPDEKRVEACCVYEFDSEFEEAAWVAGSIAQSLEGGLLPRNICVLVKQRPNQYVTTLLQEMQKLKVKGRVENDYQDILSEPLTAYLLTLVKLAFSERAPRDWHTAIDLLYTLRYGGSDWEDNRQRSDLGEKLFRFLESWKVLISATEEPEALLEAIVQAVKFLGEGDIKNLHPQYRQGNQLMHICKQLADALWKYHETGTDWLEIITNFQGHDTVPVMTVHKSKGLEYHTVIFIGLEDGAFWSFKTQKDEDTCAFFVAFSRAQEKVIFTFSQVRDTGKGMRPQKREVIGALYDVLRDARIPVRYISGDEC